MSSLPAVTDQDFDAQVLKAPAAVVDFWGEGWGACVRLAPVLEQVAGEYKGRLKIVGANVEAAYDTASGLGIMGLPTLVFYKGGREVHRIVGGVDRTRLVKAIKDNLGIWMGQIAQITEQQFASEVTRSSVPVLVDFHAAWCGPCKALAPVLEDVARHYGARLKIIKMDVDEAQETAVRLGIMGVPTLILFKNGEESWRSGNATKTALVTELDKVL